MLHRISKPYTIFVLLLLMLLVDFLGTFFGPSAQHIIQIIGERALRGNLDSIEPLVAPGDRDWIPKCVRSEPMPSIKCATYLPAGHQASGYRYSLEHASPFDSTRTYNIKFFYDHRSSIQTNVVLYRYGKRWYIKLKPES